MIAEVLSYLRGGFSPLPIRTDGTKAPAIAEWKPLQSSPLSEAEAESVFSENVGVAIICGEVSGNLEVLDFDHPTIFHDWDRRMSEAHGDKWGAVRDTLPHVETPDGGDHLYYRCEEIGGSQKLAMSAEPYKGRTGKTKRCMIEIKGEGGYVLAPGSPDVCHEANLPYRHTAGPPISETPVIPADMRLAMILMAESMSEAQPTTERWESARSDKGGRPGDEYDARGPEWSEILEPHGWQKLRTRKGVTDWRRAGKRKGQLSATTGHTGACLYVFSENAQPFEARRAYSKFQAYTLLEHGGDFSAAARELAKQGYGSNGNGNGQSYDIGPEDPEYVRSLLQDMRQVMSDGGSIQVATRRSALPVEPFPTATYTGLPTRAVWAIEGLLEQNTCVLIAAEPKSGKTWFTFDMAIALATGERMLGEFGAYETGPTLFYSPEGSSRSRHSRIVGLCWGRGLDPEIVMPDLLFLDADLNLCAEGHAERLGATVDATGARLMVIDPMVTAALGIDENTTEIMSILNPLRQIVSKRPKLSMVVVHHTNKMAKQLTRGLAIRGSSAIAGWYDTLITIRNRDDDSGGPRRVDVDHRDNAAPQEFGMQLVYGDKPEHPGLNWFRLDRCEAPELTQKAEPPGRRLNADLLQSIRTLIESNPGAMTRAAGARHLAEQKSTFNRHFAALLEQGDVYLSKNGKMLPKTRQGVLQKV